METKTLNEAAASDEILKVTALLYFQEALFAQDYEACAELVNAAASFGAQQSEIDAAIAAYLRADKAGGQKRANPKKRSVM